MDHVIADALISFDDNDFSKKESGVNMDMVCVKVFSQVKPVDDNILRREKDPVIITVRRYVREGWPPKHTETNKEVQRMPHPWIKSCDSIEPTAQYPRSIAY